MYLSDEELADRISSESNLVNKLEIRKLHNGGRRPGDKNIPRIMQEIIAVTARSDGPTKAARAFDIPIPRASLYKDGIVSQHLGVNSDFKQSIDKQSADREEKAHNSALDALLSTLEIVNEKASEISSPRLASKIASDMARVVNSLKPAAQTAGISAQQIIIYAPEQRHVATYETVDITAPPLD